MTAERLLQEQVSVGEAIVRVLEQAGIEFVFGMPGGNTGAIFNALYFHQDRIRTVLAREEGLATVMAVFDEGICLRPFRSEVAREHRGASVQPFPSTGVVERRSNS